MNKIIKYILGALFVLVLGVLFYTKIYIPKTTYKTISPIVGNLEVNVKAIGNVGAKNIYEITPQIGGKVLKINTDVGMWVKKGDLLVTIDGIDLKEQLAVAEATFRKMQYDIEVSKNELNNQESQKVLLDITYKRYTKLKEKKFASQSEYDKAKAELEGINASIKATQARVSSAKMNAEIASKNKDIIQAKIQRLNIYAPIDGYVVSKNVEVAQTIGSTTTVLKIVDVSSLWVVTKIDERVSANIKVGQKATIVLRANPDKIYEGIVRRVYATNDAVTLEKEVDVAFVHVPKEFYINAQAEVKILSKIYYNVVKIPTYVVVEKKGILGVWVVKNSYASFVKIEIIAQTNQEVALKNFDLKNKIIILNTHKKPLTEGMKIHL